MNSIDVQNEIEIENQEYLKDKITSVFEELDQKRQKQKNDIKELENAVFLKEKDKFQMTDLFELYQTFKSHIWENLYANVELLFDVKGLDEASDANASLQKHNLQKYFELAKLGSVLNKAIDYLLLKSEAIIFVGWKTKEKYVRRKGRINNFSSKKQKANQEILIEKQKIYDGLDLRAINPENVVFTEEKDVVVYQTFVSFSELENLFVRNFSNIASLDEIKNYANSLKSDSNEKGVVDDKIELLEYWGDIKLSDGTIAKNQVIVVAARKFIIRQELNPYIINPFVIMNLLEDPDTKRGFLYLKTALPIKNKAQQIFINQLRALEFITNPAYLAPKGAFSNIEQSAEPGKIIEYEASLMPQAPIPLNMSGALQGWEFLSYLKNIEETTTGIFKNFTGVIDKARSATEVQATVGGQNSRLAMIIDQINEDLILPIVEKAADLISNLIFEDEKILIFENDKKISETINAVVRNGNYKYVYGDRNSTQLKKLKLKEMFDVCVNMVKFFPEIKNDIDASKAFQFVLQEYGYDNFERFKKDELPKQLKQSTDFFIARND